MVHLWSSIVRERMHYGRLPLDASAHRRPAHFRLLGFTVSVAVTCYYEPAAGHLTRSRGTEVPGRFVTTRPASVKTGERSSMSPKPGLPDAEEPELLGAYLENFRRVSSRHCKVAT